MNQLISVIIPIYNIREYINDCVQSVCSQSYKNLEIILVDDGSSDGSEHICDEYRSKDERIKVIHKNNGGLSDARNVAIDLCSGDYITFIDGDDIVSNNYIEKLYTLINNTESQIAICRHKDFIRLPIGDTFKSELFEEYSPADAIREILINGQFTTSAWGKLYKKNLFDSIRYPKGRLFEDLPTTWKTFDLASKIVFTPSQEYYYRQNPTSIMNSKFNPKKLDILFAHQSLIAGLENRRPELVELGYTRASTYSAILLYSAIMSGYINFGDLKKLRSEIRKYLKYMMKGSYPFRIKIFGFFASLPGFVETVTFLNKLRGKGNNSLC